MEARGVLTAKALMRVPDKPSDEARSIKVSVARRERLNKAHKRAFRNEIALRFQGKMVHY